MTSFPTTFPQEADSRAHFRNKFAQSLDESSSVLGYEKGKSVVRTPVKRHSSFIAGYFAEISEKHSSSNSESESAADEFAGSSTEIMGDDEMVLPMDESEIQPTYHKIGNLAVETISDGNKRLLPIHEVKFEAVALHFEGDGRAEPGLNASVKQPVKSVSQIATPKLGSSNCCKHYS